VGDLSDIERDFPGWHAWRGVGDTGWYARRVKSSPPVVLRAESKDELKAKGLEHQAARERP
jgi:hypothetical protein